MVATKTPMHVRDVMAGDAYLARRDTGAVAAVELRGARTVLSMPLLDKGKMIGAFFLCRQRVQSFTDKQIKVVQHFATQAVIAIEHARLLKELRERTSDLTEALGEQKAISGVLQLLNDSRVSWSRSFKRYLKMRSTFAGRTSAICSFTRMARSAGLRCLTHRKRT